METGLKNKSCFNSKVITKLRQNLQLLLLFLCLSHWLHTAKTTTNTTSMTDAALTLEMSQTQTKDQGVEPLHVTREHAYYSVLERGNISMLKESGSYLSHHAWSHWQGLYGRGLCHHGDRICCWLIQVTFKWGNNLKRNFVLYDV